jgi:hypothetical protein
MKVFQKRVLRKIFGPKTDEVTAGWRKLHKEELRDQVEEDEVGACSMNGGEKELV